MTRTEIVALMKQKTARLVELGQVVHVALGAQQHTAEDLAAIMTAADATKSMADEFNGAVAGAVGKDARVATDFERGIRQWSMGCRLIADGVSEPSPKLLAMGNQHVKAGAGVMAEALSRLS